MGRYSVLGAEVGLLLPLLTGSRGCAGQLTSQRFLLFTGSLGGVFTRFMAAIAPQRAQAWEFPLIRALLRAGSPGHPTTSAGREGGDFRVPVLQQSPAPSGRGCPPRAEQVALAEEMELGCLCPSCPSLRARPRQHLVYEAAGVK